MLLPDHSIDNGRGLRLVYEIDQRCVKKIVTPTILCE